MATHITSKKVRTILILDKKVPEIKPSEMFTLQPAAELLVSFTDARLYEANSSWDKP